MRLSSNIRYYHFEIIFDDGEKMTAMDDNAAATNLKKEFPDAVSFKRRAISQYNNTRISNFLRKSIR